MLEWCKEHPELVTALVVALLNVVAEGLRKVSPVASDALASLIPHARSLVEAIRKRKTQPPPPAALILLVVLGGGALGLTGCHRSELEHGLEGVRDVVQVAEPCLVESRANELSACAGDAPCEAQVKARWSKVADGLDAFREAWCILAPGSEGCS